MRHLTLGTLVLQAIRPGWFSKSIRAVPPEHSTQVRYALPILIAALLVGCSSRVEHLTDLAYPPREQDAPVEWLAGIPTQPYIELARITMSNAIVSETTLRQDLLERARNLGADAIVELPPAIMTQLAPSPYYEASLLGPMGAAFGLYGYGWYTPYSSNPYLLSQGATDQPIVRKYLSGVAIRYPHQTEPQNLP